LTSSRIARLAARQVLDSRGRPTVEADIHLEDGSFGRASVPSGASTGRYEAHELRDGDKSDFDGRSVRRAVAGIKGEISDVLRGRDALDQRGIDAALRALDGTPDLSRLGANATLAASLAVSRAAAAHRKSPLHQYLASLDPTASPSLPLPMMNVLSGGAHAARAMDFQDFLVVPVGAKGFAPAMAMLWRVRQAASDVAEERGLPTLLADEGGLSPGFRTAAEGLELMVRAIERAGLRPGADAAIAIDVAASEFFRDRVYALPREGRELDGEGMLAYVAELCRKFPIVSVEDPLAEDDWEHWRELTETLPIQIVGDDLFATNAMRIAEGIKRGAANAVLVKLNQNGTLTGTLDAMAIARHAGYAAVISARSGETEDAFMSDFAVATGAGQIKVGSLRNSERLAKYNQLLRIAEDASIPYAGAAALAGAKARTPA
jgi:enolase